MTASAISTDQRHAQAQVVVGLVDLGRRVERQQLRRRRRVRQVERGEAVVGADDAGVDRAAAGRRGDAALLRAVRAHDLLVDREADRDVLVARLLGQPLRGRRVEREAGDDAADRLAPGPLHLDGRAVRRVVELLAGQQPAAPRPAARRSGPDACTGPWPRRPVRSRRWPAPSGPPRCRPGSRRPSAPGPRSAGRRLRPSPVRWPTARRPASHGSRGKPTEPRILLPGGGQPSAGRRRF